MTTTTNDKTITNEVTVQAPLDLVWYAWTISERVSEWFAPETVIEAQDGGAYELYFIPGNKTEMNTKGCKIINLVDGEELRFTWKGPDQFESIMNNENELTAVTVRFESVTTNSTKVVVEHTGFKDHDNWKEAIEGHQMAWAGVLSSLKSALEKGEGNLCCQPIK
ncbi:SRPBCC family protein [Ferdinandcohnia quinoae]|uniref:SRPBCC domain-containing protein n=1 Tax=Fredinandcohnia quinoae TaxID=2918902 RepID=A0AAW5EEW7_9BACI|nr:SRPBCC domain-containing protein [Fredinandcohnia sp. SECRCQ15]MCH1627723.1 SRPBCC domain-containing protein [Fredinandcohnia sp. SECRCQ15]